MPEDSWFAASDQDRERFRRFRHALPEIVNDTVRRRGYLKVNSDYAVPLDRNLEMLELYHQGLRECSLDYVIFGHIGDAHVHVNILPKSESEFKAGQELMLDYMETTDATGELPLYNPDTYARALESGSVPGRRSTNGR